KGALPAGVAIELAALRWSCAIAGHPVLAMPLPLLKASNDILAAYYEMVGPEIEAAWRESLKAVPEYAVSRFRAGMPQPVLLSPTIHGTELLLRNHQRTQKALWERTKAAMLPASSIVREKIQQKNERRVTNAADTHDPSKASWQTHLNRSLSYAHREQTRNPDWLREGRRPDPRDNVRFDSSNDIDRGFEPPVLEEIAEAARLTEQEKPFFFIEFGPGTF